MKAAFLAASAAMLMAGSAQAAITIGGYTFTSSATSVTGSPPIDSSEASREAWQSEGGSVVSVLTDLDPYTWAAPNNIGSFVTLGFANGILNGAGNDFVLFELSNPDSFTVTINNVSVVRKTLATGFTVSAPGFPGQPFSLNAAAFDLTEFGLAAGSSISQMRIMFDVPNPPPNTLGPAAFSFAGVLNTGTGAVVPEPSTWMLMIMGFGLIAQQLRRRHRGVAQVAA